MKKILASLAVFTALLTSCLAVPPPPAKPVKVHPNTNVINDPAGTAFQDANGIVRAAQITVPRVLYVETTGDNGTAVVGDPSHPYATLAGAVSIGQAGSGNYVIRMGVGSHTTATLAADWPSRIQIKGAGRDVSTVAIAGGSTYNISLVSDGTVKLTSVTGKAVTLTRAYCGTVTSTGGVTPFVLQDCETTTVSVVSGVSATILRSTCTSVTANSLTTFFSITDSVTTALQVNSCGSNVTSSRCRHSTFTAQDCTAGTVRLTDGIATTVSCQRSADVTLTRTSLTGGVTLAQTTAATNCGALQIVQSLVPGNVDLTATHGNGGTLAAWDSSFGTSLSTDITLTSSTDDGGSAAIVRCSGIDDIVTDGIANGGVVNIEGCHVANIHNTGTTNGGTINLYYGASVGNYTNTGGSFTPPVQNVDSLFFDSPSATSWKVQTGMIIDSQNSTDIHYLNFGPTFDAAGYGVRGNLGVMQYKDSGGAWTAIKAAAWANITGKPVTATAAGWAAGAAIDSDYMTQYLLDDGATISTWDVVASGATATVIIQGAGRVINISGEADGADLYLMIIQDSTGGWVPTWNAVFAFPGGTPPTLSTAPDARDLLHFHVQDHTVNFVTISLDVR